MRMRGRTVTAAILIALPVGTLVWARTAWEGRFTAELPSHWQGPGGPDATSPEEPLYWAMLWTSAVSALIALAGLIRWPLPSAGMRWWVAVFASVAAVTASMWIGPAGSTLDLENALEARPGVGVLLTMFCLVYGAIPALVRPPARESVGVAG